jgi:hypothetical protein
MQGAHTATERFGNTATDGYMGENQERPNFNNPQLHSQHQKHRDEDHHIQHPHEDAPEMYTEMPHQLEAHDQMFNDDEPSKMFTFEDGNQQQMLQTSQEEKQSQRSGMNNNQQKQAHNFGGAPSRTQQHDNMGHLMFVQSGRNHSLHLTRDGDVFSYGSGVQCAVGHGGARSEFTPTILKPLRDKRIIQIACGEHHSLVLTDKADVYAWGRGFEGQLGISKSVQIASTP